MLPPLVAHGLDRPRFRNRRFSPLFPTALGSAEVPAGQFLQINELWQAGSFLEVQGNSRSVRLPALTLSIPRDHASTVAGIVGDRIKVRIYVGCNKHNVSSVLLCAIKNAIIPNDSCFLCIITDGDRP